MSKSITYKNAGVDIEKAESALSRLKQRIARTYTPEVLTGIGLFGGFYDLSGLGFSEPVLVASTDGVGTKLKVAMLAGRHDTVGQDLVHHCINDIAVCGAQPLFFLDYFATGALEPSVYEAVVSGIARACENAGIPLIGGETAEMPDFYAPGEYDLCGTIVGAVEKSRIIDGSKIAPGDVLVGIVGNGLHTNGYTLARKVLFSHYSVDTVVEELGGTLGEELLKIHPNYHPLIRQVVETVEVHGIAHITGGGIEQNTRRLLREGLNLQIDWGSWPVPPIFQLIQRLGGVPDEDMRQTFNLGIGLVIVVAPEQMQPLMEAIEQAGYSAYRLGCIRHP